MWEKRQTNNWYGMKAGKLEPGKVKQQLGGAPELRGLEEGLWGRWDQVKPATRITYEWENKKAAVGKTILLRHTNTTLVTRVRLSRVVPTHIASDEQCLLQPCPQGLAL